MTIQKLLIPALVIFVFSSASTFAQLPSDMSMAPLVRIAANDPMSLDEAAAMVRKQTGGRVLSADKQTRNGQTVYRIKVLMPSGVVKVVQVDAASGKTR